jgi:hypothetical protein
VRHSCHCCSIMRFSGARVHIPDSWGGHVEGISAPHVLMLVVTCRMC